jgi:hypothetical protein
MTKSDSLVTAPVNDVEVAVFEVAVASETPIAAKPPIVIPRATASGAEWLKAVSEIASIAESTPLA